MVESRQADESEPYLYDNDNDRTDLFYSAGTVHAQATRLGMLKNIHCIWFY